MGIVKSDRALEAQHYWRVMLAGVDFTPVAEFRDEIQVLSKHATSPVLKSLCDRNERRFNGRISTGLVAQAR